MENNQELLIEFESRINELENSNCSEDILIKYGNVPILFSAPHAVLHCKNDGTIKLNEPYTKAIALFLHEKMSAFAIVKVQDTGMDSNKDNHDEYKRKLIELVKDNDIKLIIDLHGASTSHDFDVEFGTLNNLSSDYSTIKELEEAFISNGIKNISHNDPFKGGAITQYLYNLKDVDVIQLEINRKYRDIENIDLLKSLTDSLITFVDKYNNYINR